LRITASTASPPRKGFFLTRWHDADDIAQLKKLSALNSVKEISALLAQLVARKTSILLRLNLEAVGSSP